MVLNPDFALFVDWAHRHRYELLRTRLRSGVPTVTIRIIHDLEEYRKIGGITHGLGGVLVHPADSLVLKLPDYLEPRTDLTSDLRLLARVSWKALRKPGHLASKRNWGTVQLVLNSVIHQKRTRLRDPKVWTRAKLDPWSEVRIRSRHAAQGLPVVVPLGVVVDRKRGQEFVCEPRLPKLCGVIRKAWDTDDSRLLSWARQAWDDSVGLFLRNDAWGDVHLGNALVQGTRVVFTDSDVVFGQDMKELMKRDAEWWCQALGIGASEASFDVTRFDDAVDLHFRLGLGCQSNGRIDHAQSG